MDFGQHLLEIRERYSDGIGRFQDEIITAAVQLLRKDIQDPQLNSTEVPPDTFMLRANQIGIALLHNGFFSLAERLYRVLTQETLSYRQDPDKWRHAGALFANTGVACAAQRNIDQAVVELLKAVKEDERTYQIPPTDSFAVTGLLQEYFGKPVRSIALSVAQSVNPNIALGDIEHASNLLGRNEYAFWSYVYIAGTHEEANKIFENDFSDLQIFSSIRSLSALLEVHLKTLNGNLHQTFFPAITGLFNKKPWWNDFERERARVGATQNSGIPVDQQLNDAISIAPTDKDSYFWRSLLVSYIARNYTIHQMDITSPLIQSHSSVVLGHIINVIAFADR